jgi:hypothetical protein
MNKSTLNSQVMRRFLQIILLIGLGNSVLYCSGGVDDSSMSHQSFHTIVVDDIKIGFNDALGYFGAPFYFSEREWIIFASGVAATTCIMFTDKEIKRLVEKDHRRIFAGEYQNIPVKYGQVEYGSILSAGLYGIGLFAKMDGLRITGRMLIQSLSYSGSSVMILRWAFGRTRPFLTNDSWDFNWFKPRFRMQAFPSGHATVSFALSTILSNRINNTYVSVGLFGLALLDGFLQVYNHQHWLSDIIVGGVMGIGTSMYVISQEEKRRSVSSTTQSRFSIMPGNGGIKIAYKF